MVLATSLNTFAQETYRNPVINADVPDISVCKVQDTYYMVSTTMHLMPGAPIMKSKDMVNWEIVSYVFDRIDDGPRYNLEGGATVYGQGQWASSIRYHMGKFYVWFTANGAPGKGFVYSADKAEGPWTLVARPPHMHDGSLFFDEDGMVYMFCENGRLKQLDPQTFEPLKGGIDKQLFERDAEERGSLLEGSSVIKHNGKYYLCMISMKWGVQGRFRREVCYRADNIEGPYEKKIILETPFETYGGVGQGCLVGDDQSDKGWMALIFQDRGGIGRVPCTLPVTWIDGWPMVGEFTGKINNAVTESKGDNPSGDIRLDKRAYKTPSDLSKKHPSVKGIIGSDEFDLPVEAMNRMNKGSYHANMGLKLYWQWNHNPIDEAWSLTERPGFMRLKTARVVDNLNVAPNTLTQRMSGPECTGAIAMDISKMKDGDICGFAAYNGDSGVLRIVKKGGKTVLQLTEEKAVFKQPRNIDRVDVEVLEEVKLKGKMVYLKIHGDFNPGRDMASFSYSTDGENWKSIGREVAMRFDYTRHFMGTKFAIFNYATKKLGGYVDVDWFHFEEE
ncbi:MAG: glycoside hydrolase 43 family protein [Bacteroidaceae bacterium]|nr:glycoside hydrolase 43 family protein [Bacteroidaceae bacterium]